MEAKPTTHNLISSQAIATAAALRMLLNVLLPHDSLIITYDVLSDKVLC
jgi:hypothetical protein